MTVTVDADAGVFPAGSTLSAAMIADEADVARIEDAVEEAAGVPSEQTFTFDIRVLDADGNELQPDPDKGEVRVSFASDAIAEAAEDEDMRVQVYHVDDALDTAEPVETSVTADDASGETPAAEIVAEHFSYYTITTITSWTDLPTTPGSTLTGNYKLSSSATITASTGGAGGSGGLGGNSGSTTPGNSYLYGAGAITASKGERELTENGIAIMLSRLQPHFLFNALMAIQELCHIKSPEAEDAVVEFAEFLRGNLDSLRQHGPIPFENELHHTQNYLALEGKRFSGRIHVRYDIRTMSFQLPALTLQPLVENAVRYGVTQKEEGGMIRISTAEDKTGYRLTVEDDGVGFDVMTEKPDGRTHIGISSVGSRLKAMCGGTLTVQSVPGKGTTSVVFIPKQTQPIRRVFPGKRSPGGDFPA